MKKPSSPAPIPERRRQEDRHHAKAILPDFQSMTDNAAQGILVHSNFRPLYVNAAFAKLFGYDSPDAIMALPLIRPLIPVDMWARIEEEYDALMRSEKAFVFTRSRGVRKDGTEIWVSVTHRVLDWHGTPAMQINAFDITKHMKIEQTMLNSEQSLRAMLEILPVPVYIARREDGQLLFVNRKTCLLFQESAGRLLRAKSIDFFVDADDRNNLSQLLDTVRDIRDVEVRMRTAQGREFVAELAAITIEYGGHRAVLVSLNDISHRKLLEAELLQQANTDELTGIDNRRNFLVQAEQEMRRARRFSRSLSIMMIDLDHFKSINDRFGHAIGDVVLQNVVKACQESLRESDIIGRLGGEEFAVIMPETSLDAAVDVANRLRQHIVERPIITIKGTISCSASVGVAHIHADDPSADDLLQRADDAMYRAKENGRNRVEIENSNG